MTEREAWEAWWTSVSGRWDDEDDPIGTTFTAGYRAALGEAAKAWEEGVRAWAWWKDGVQYVGTCGTTLARALEKNPYRALAAPEEGAG